jgi:hypothetical protein
MGTFQNAWAIFRLAKGDNANCAEGVLLGPRLPAFGAADQWRAVKLGNGV